MYCPCDKVFAADTTALIPTVCFGSIERFVADKPNILEYTGATAKSTYSVALPSFLILTISDLELPVNSETKNGKASKENFGICINGSETG
jgi:hypothetical protein